jgi:serine/threonine protein kinase
MSRHVRDIQFLLLRRRSPLILFLLLAGLRCSASTRQFSTVAISHATNSTLVCALVRTTNDGGAAANSKLHCTSLPDGELFVYPSADIPYNAIAAGTDFLCGLMAPHGGHAAMRWWSFSEEAAANRSRPVGRRLYWGPSLRELSAGGAHACGLSDDHDPACWEWPGLTLPKGMDFSRIALGQNFLCGIVSGTNDTGMRCFGGRMRTPSLLLPVTLRAVAAGHRHACVADAEGGFACWGEDDEEVPAVPAEELPESMRGMALGRNTTCLLAGDGTVRCWGAVRVPARYASTAFVAVEADGEAVCGIMMANYSVACWGAGRDHGIVYNGTMPGACVSRASCRCDIVAGSGALCGTGGGEGGVELAVCASCTLPLNASRIVIDSRPSSSAPPTTSGGGDADKKKRKKLVVALGAGAAAIAAVGTAFYLAVFRKRDRKKARRVTVQLGEPPSSLRLCRDMESSSPVARPSARPLGCEEFTLRELSRLTDGFAEERKIGCGSFGSVYRARLPDGREVAVKRAEHQSHKKGRRRRVDSERAFRSELRLLSRVNHRNLVQLLGFCEERGERILVFEFMPHGALHDHLHKETDPSSAPSPLFSSWEARLRVALDAARGVEYLHLYAVPAIIHRDVKPSNILLDAQWTAKVSDFGLSLASSGGASHQSSQPSSTTSTAGTVGYMDPEYYRLQELTERSDVYSFGVVLLELVTGRKAIHRTTSQDGGSGSPRNVIEFAVPAVEAGNIAGILDGRVPPPRGHEVEAVARVAKIAAECVRPRGRARPIMSEVVAELEWAVTLCEECVVATAGGAQNSSRHAGSDMWRSESDDPSPFHTSELGFDPSRAVLTTHGRSHSSAM